MSQVFRRPGDVGQHLPLGHAAVQCCGKRLVPKRINPTSQIVGVELGNGILVGFGAVDNGRVYGRRGHPILLGLHPVHEAISIDRAAQDIPIDR